MAHSLLTGDLTGCLEELGAENTAACSAADSVVGQSHKFPVKKSIGTESSDRDAEAALIIDVQLNLRTVLLLEILNEIPGWP